MTQLVHRLSDEDLISILDKRVELESLNEAEIVDFIREVMSRRLFLKYGANSMFDFLTHAHFHYAPAVAQRKLDAARLMQLFPEVKDLIASGEINLSQIGMFASALRQKSLAPKIQRRILESLKGQTIKNTQAILNEAFELEIKSHERVRVQRDGSVRVEMTFSKEELEMIERAKNIVSHSVPSGELSQVLTYCARFTVSKKDNSLSTRKDASISSKRDVSLPSMEVKPRQSQEVHHQNVSSQIKGVSRRARRFIFQRDRSCRHRHENGRLCESRYQLQVDHVISRWKGGSHDVHNLQLLCGIHNRHKYETETERTKFAARPLNSPVELLRR